MNTRVKSGSGVTGTPPATPARKVRVAIVGCGAQAQKKLLPAIARSTRLKTSVLVDVDEVRLNRLGNEVGVKHLFRNVADVAAHADIAVIAVPHHLHAPIAIEAMKAGLHVFVEKPLATNMRDVSKMLEASAFYRRKIGVGLVRRQYPSYKYVKALLQQGCIGKVKSFDFREGATYNWPVTTLATFKKETEGGTLFDKGAHTLDMLLSWLGDFREIIYREDSHGGTEANCVLDITLSSGATGTVELSRTRNLRNTCVIRGDCGEIEVGIGVRGPVTLRTNGIEMTADPRVIGQEEMAPLDFTRIQIEEFCDALENLRDCELFAENTLGSIQLFDACKVQPASIDLVWEAFRAPKVPGLVGRKVLVIGGTGFIGGRLVEALAQKTQAQVRVMFRDPSRLPNILRFEIETVQGDLTNPSSLDSALGGCDLVVNCSVGRGSKEASELVNVEAVKNLLRKAARAGIQRVVHLSTASVYGVSASGVLHENNSQHAERSYVYGYTKWKGELAGFAVAREVGIEFVALQPTIVYGPGAPSWTINPLRMLKSGQVVLVNGGDGICNAVYVDDVVMAILCAADSKAGAGERYLVSGPETVTWREFYGAYEAMIGRKSTISMSLDELDRYRKEQAKRARNVAQLLAVLRDPNVYSRLVRLPMIEWAKSLLPRTAIDAAKQIVRGAPEPASAANPGDAQKPWIHVWSPLDAQLQCRKARISIEKAEREVGYRPSVGFREGMALTQAWARWANLLP